MKRYSITAWDLRAGDLIWPPGQDKPLRVMQAIQDPENSTVYVRLYFGNSSHMPASKHLIVSRENETLPLL